MERRVLLAIFLAFIVLYTWQALFVKPVPKPAPGSATTTAESTPTATGAAAGTDSALPSSAPAAAAKPAVPLAPALVAESAERDVRVETRDVIAIFTNKGARLKSWRLKRYVDQERQPQELIEHLPSQPLPFTLRAGNDATTAALNDGLYAVSGAPSSASESSPVDLRFKYATAPGSAPSRNSISIPSRTSSASTPTSPRRTSRSPRRSSGDRPSATSRS